MNRWGTWLLRAERWCTLVVGTFTSLLIRCIKWQPWIVFWTLLTLRLLAHATYLEKLIGPDDVDPTGGAAGPR